MRIACEKPKVHVRVYTVYIRPFEKGDEITETDRVGTVLYMCGYLCTEE